MYLLLFLFALAFRLLCSFPPLVLLFAPLLLQLALLHLLLLPLTLFRLVRLPLSLDPRAHLIFFELDAGVYSLPQQLVALLPRLAQLLVFRLLLQLERPEKALDLGELTRVEGLQLTRLLNARAVALIVELELDVGMVFAGDALVDTVSVWAVTKGDDARRRLYASASPTLRMGRDAACGGVSRLRCLGCGAALRWSSSLHAACFMFALKQGERDVCSDLRQGLWHVGIGRVEAIRVRLVV